jgi:hypothetical protein
MLTEDAEGKTEIDKLVLKYMGLVDEWELFWQDCRTI